MSSVTPAEKGRPDQHGFPLRLFAAAFAISLLVVAVGAGLSWRLQGRLDELRVRQFHLTEYVSRIMLFDEALTMSAHMAAATGDFAYKQRYDQLDAELAALINETKSSLHRPEVRHFIEQTDEANRKLVEIERRAFALASEGRLTEATALLVSEEYLTLKGIYADGVEKTVAWQRSAIEAEQRALHYLTVGFQISSGLIVLLLLFSWYFALRTGRRWSQERLRSEAALRKAHDELELRVRERTADLQLANDTLRHRTGALTHAAEERERANDKLEIANDRIEKQNLRFDAALNNMSQGLCMFDRDQRVVVTNERYLDMYGLSAEQAKPGTMFRDLLQHRVEGGSYPAGPPPDAYIVDLLASLARGSAWIKVTELPDGRSVAVSNRAMPDGGWVATHEDITERRRAEARITHLAHHDGLTDLPNRALMRERLEQAVTGMREGDRRLAVLMLDLDRFKEVNDTLGHSVGDALLKVVTERLRSCVRETDTIARLGGDEFAILQRVTEPATETAALAKRIQEVIAAPFDLDHHHVTVGTSIGIAMAPGDGTDPDQLMKNADLALYRAKSEGRGTYRFFEPEMDQRMQARRSLERDLRSALINGEFALHYQPLVNIERDEICGFEALLRWTHPERGKVAPADFIPLAEEMGLIVPIGEWILRQACTDAATWPKHLKIAVSVSVAQFKSRNLVELVIRILAATGIAPQRLELEITESVMFQDREGAFEILTRLHDLGVRIALDEFGTGYSSLSNLRKFPFDKIKIDRSFVSDLSAANIDALAVVRSIAHLGVSLGMSTTAENVETQEQMAQVRAEGCTEMQGFLFSKAVPAHEIPRLLLTQSHKPASAA